ncbi:hypothetical protein TNCV_2842821 [Trichonephila clavipes]|nr:hypothetical protein TNCV_2842821 [Trichonephila clavipes]
MSSPGFEPSPYGTAVSVANQYTGWKQGTQQLETAPGFEETLKESIRSGPEFVVANGAMLAREKETKLTPPGGYNCDVNGHVHPSDIQSSK